VEETEGQDCAKNIAEFGESCVERDVSPIHGKKSINTYRAQPAIQPIIMLSISRASSRVKTDPIA